MKTKKNDNNSFDTQDHRKKYRTPFKSKKKRELDENLKR